MEDLSPTGPSWDELLHDHLETDGHLVGRGAIRRGDQADLPTEFEVRTAALDAGTVYVVELHPLAPTGEAPHAKSTTAFWRGSHRWEAAAARA